MSNETINVRICLSYTTHFIFVKTNLTQIENFNGFDKCYIGIIDNNLKFRLTYELFGELNSKDEIMIVVFDRPIEVLDTEAPIYRIKYEY